VLLVCMTSDTGPHTNCALIEQNRRVLLRRGLTDVTLVRLDGTHQLDLARLAPVLDAWLVAGATSVQAR